MTALVALASSFLIASPAHAYPEDDIQARYLLVDTGGSCTKSAPAHPDAVTLAGTVVDEGSTCFHDDLWDYTRWSDDVGGKGVKIELWLSGNMIGKVEWHPYGEHLWVYDTRNDSDTFYVEITSGCLIDGGPIGPYNAPANDYVDIDLDLGEGCSLTLNLYDSKADYPGGLGYEDIVHIAGGKA
jgi:hypothetical protein